jgi:hypothetical protein
VTASGGASELVYAIAAFHAEDNETQQQTNFFAIPTKSTALLQRSRRLRAQSFGHVRSARLR